MKILETLLAQTHSTDFCGILIGPLANLVSTWQDKLSEYVPQLTTFLDWEEFKKHKGPRLFLIHFEAVPPRIAKICKYKKFNWGCIDESHRIAKRGTKQSKAASRLSWIKRKLILTGTPIEKISSDLWAQFRFLLPELWGKNWAEWEKEYMDYPILNMDRVKKGSEAWKKRLLQQTILKRKAVIAKGKKRQIAREIKPYAIRLTQEDVGIQRAIIKRTPVDIRGYQREMYERMKKDHVIRLRDGTRIMSELAITDVVRLRQIASGFVYDEDKEVHRVGRAKLRAMRRIMDRSKKPVIIFAVFKPDLLAIQAELKKEGYRVALVYGKVSKKKRPDIWRKFQRAKYDAIILQTRVGGVGLDLWKASTAIVYSMGHSFIDWDQLRARMDNVNKDKPSEIFVLCGKNTIDEDIYELVIEKGLNSRSVLSTLRRRYNNGQK